MSGELDISNFDLKIRKVPGPDGKRWYVLGDASRVLKYANPHSLSPKLAPDEKGIAILDTPGGPQRVVIVSRPGLLKLCANSEKEEARLIDRWLRHEVAESVFDTGSYSVPAFKPSLGNNPVITALESALQMAREQEAIKRDVSEIRVEQAQIADQMQQAEARAREAEAKIREADARMAEAEIRIAEANATAARAQAESLKATQEANRAFRVVSSETDWFCLVTWAETKGVHLAPPHDAIEGKVVTAMCRAEGVAPGTHRTTRYPGGVHTYPERILNAWLEGYKFRGPDRTAQ